MSHPNQLAFVKVVASILASHYAGGKIAEIGSYAVNGGVREYFDWTKNYVGIDLTDGPGVDVVSSGHEFGESNSYDVAISCEVFEHNPYWLETFLNMIRITKSNGIVIFTCASRGRIEHGTCRTNRSDSPGTSSLGWSYYRNLLVGDFTKRIDLSRHFSFYRFYQVKSSKDLYFLGIKHAYSCAHNDTEQANWLQRQVHVVDRLINEMNTQPAFTTSREYPILSTMRMFPVSLAAYLLPDKLFQDFYFIYVPKTARLKRLLLGRRD